MPCKYLVSDQYPKFPVSPTPHTLIHVQLENVHVFLIFFLIFFFPSLIYNLDLDKEEPSWTLEGFPLTLSTPGGRNHVWRYLGALLQVTCTLYYFSLFYTLDLVHLLCWDMKTRQWVCFYFSFKCYRIKCRPYMQDTAIQRLWLGITWFLQEWKNKIFLLNFESECFCTLQLSRFSEI